MHPPQNWVDRSLRASLMVLMLFACANTASAQERPGSFVDARMLIPDLVVDMRYAGSDNFVGRPIAGYEAPICLLTRQAATALTEVQHALAPFGLGLKVFDCFRPRRAVADFVRWAQDPADQARKAEYYPRIDKSTLFVQGYIANRSGHSRGSTVDLTLIDLATGQDLDMGSGFDLFDTLSWPTEASMTPAQRANRLLLQSVMRAQGFRPYRQEWWHFTLDGEPFPETHFDFPVAAQ
jgi:D-alanyl-D-alanine dipeptidase